MREQRLIRWCVVGLLALLGSAPAAGAADGEVCPVPARSRAAAGATASDVPWWDDYPALIQGGDAALAARVHASAAMCGSADDPTWGLFGQRQRLATSGDRIREPHAAGVKALAWFEGFGTAGSCYIAQVKRTDEGIWIRTDQDRTLTRVFLNHWGWHTFDGTGEIRWVGAHNYYDDEEFARPYTRAHPRYGAPPMTYPDGRLATGCAGSADDPRTHRVYDAGCSKDVLGRVFFEYHYNGAVNRIRKETGEPAGPITGLLSAGEAPAGVPDPGFTPEEWARLKRQRYSGNVSPGKDTACPMWIDYARASVRQALDAGIDGLWVDNFSPWDSLNGRPILKAFGEWSVAGFPGFLREHLPKSELQALGISERFDVREYLRERCRAWGGNPEDLNDRVWRDPRWQDDPVWRAYLVYKRRVGTEALSKLYRAYKEEAVRAGKPDFLVSGNDIPIFSLGWVRGDLDMVSTELPWGWGLTTGPRGLMPPPLGSYVPVYTLAREHARGRFVNAWMYVPEAQKGKPNIARVLYYQALAAHAGPMPHYGPAHTAGTEAVDAEFFGFMRRAAPLFGRREAIADAGLYHSSSSQLVEMLPGGFRDHADQTHSFSFWGWGTALTHLHAPWRAVPEWKLTAETLKGLRMLILPSAEAFPQADVPILERWVKGGGLLIVAGACGTRRGEEAHYEHRETGSTLAPLLGPDGAVRPRVLGKGEILHLTEDPGLGYYRASKERPSLLPGLRQTLALLRPGRETFSLTVEGEPWQVGITPYRDRGRLFLDVNNTDIDLERDAITPAAPLRLTVALPEDLRGRGRTRGSPLHARVLSPDPAPSVEVKPLRDGRAEVSLGPVLVYASVVIEARP